MVITHVCRETSRLSLTLCGLLGTDPPLPPLRSHGVHRDAEAGPAAAASYDRRTRCADPTGVCVYVGTRLCAWLGCSAIKCLGSLSVGTFFAVGLVRRHALTVALFGFWLMTSVLFVACDHELRTRDCCLGVCTCVRRSGVCLVRRGLFRVISNIAHSTLQRMMSASLGDQVKAGCEEPPLLSLGSSGSTMVGLRRASHYNGRMHAFVA